MYFGPSRELLPGLTIIMYAILRSSSPTDRLARKKIDGMNLERGIRDSCLRSRRFAMRRRSVEDLLSWRQTERIDDGPGSVNPSAADGGGGDVVKEDHHLAQSRPAYRRRTFHSSSDDGFAAE